MPKTPEHKLNVQLYKHSMSTKVKFLQIYIKINCLKYNTHMQITFMHE